MILGIAPLRVSFAGGGTDMPEYFDEYGGNVISTTINHFTYVISHLRKDNCFQIFSSDLEVHRKPLRYKDLTLQPNSLLPVAVIKFFKYKSGLNLMISSDVPPGSGLGSSSSLAVNLVNVFSNLTSKPIEKKKLAETAHYISRIIIKWPVGKQDEYSAACGGFNLLKFSKKGTKVIPISLSKNTYDELQNNLLLFFVGGRSSSKILSDQIDRIKNKNKQTLESLHYVKELGEIMYASLKRSDITKFGQFLHDGWLAKKNFSKLVSNSKIDLIYKSAIKNGALGGKLTGAGGGGHLLLYCEKPFQKKVIKKMQEYGLQKIDFNFYNEGPKILNLYDYTQN